MRDAIKKVPGVKSVTADVRKKLVVVVFDDAAATIDKLVAASRDTGYPAEPKDLAK